MNLILEEGKYTVRNTPHGGLEALLYGEPWRGLVGDKLVQAMARRIEELEDWQAQRREMEGSWDVQAVGELLGLRLGQRIHPAIQPAIEALLTANKRLREALAESTPPLKPQ